MNRWNVKRTLILIAAASFCGMAAVCFAQAKPNEKPAAAKPAKPPKDKSKLPEISPADLKKIEDALPAKATAQPKKPHKLLVFWRCEGFFHGGGIARNNTRS